MRFELSEKEVEAKDKFYKKCKKKLKGEDVRLSYHFYPTGIGEKIVVRSENLNKEKDITDYTLW